MPPDEEQWLAREFGYCVGHAIPKIESGCMASSAIPPICIDGLAPVQLAERNFFDIEFCEHALEQSVRAARQARVQYDAGLGNGRCPCGHWFAADQLFDQRFVTACAERD